MLTVDDVLRRYGFEAAVFERLRAAYRAGTLTAAGNVIAGTVEPPAPGEIAPFPAPGSDAEIGCRVRGEAALRRGAVAVVVLNGGMATRFGSQVKACVEVYDGRTFLDLKLELVARVADRVGRPIPTLLMNSFATEEKTRARLEARGLLTDPRHAIRMFSQFVFPRLSPDGERVAVADPRLACYGPGHGDFVYVLQRSGELARLRRDGVEIIQFSNLDNLAARLDPVILGWHLAAGAAMTVEVAAKRPGDKGGTPARVDGKLRLVEGFAFPPGFDQDRIGVFNTATYVFTVAALERSFDLPWYVVEKKLATGPVIQFERLAGDLTRFLDTRYLTVDRDQRFHPIKTAADLAEQCDALRRLLG